MPQRGVWCLSRSCKQEEDRAIEVNRKDKCGRKRKTTAREEAFY